MGAVRFLETGSSFILAVYWDIWSKFSMQMYFRLLKQMKSLNVNSEVDFRLRGVRHIEKSIWRYNSAVFYIYISLYSFGNISCRLYSCIAVTVKRSVVETA